MGMLKTIRAAPFQRQCRIVYINLYSRYEGGTVIGQEYCRGRALPWTRSLQGRGHYH